MITPKFKVGDTVIVIGAMMPEKIGEIGEVQDVRGVNPWGYWYCLVKFPNYTKVIHESWLAIKES